MGSESDENLALGLDEDSEGSSFLDAVYEINDAEFQIPEVAPPSLESILWEDDIVDGATNIGSEGSNLSGGDNLSLHSLQSLTATNKQQIHTMLHHSILQGLSAQITSAQERVNTGLPTVIGSSSKYIAVGTGHGFVLTFDSQQQNMCWCWTNNGDVSVVDQGAVSALAFNLESTRLLVGYERGFICMLDASNGDLVRKLPGAHAPQSAVLHLRFTFLNGLAMCGDSSGCVFLLTFNRRLGVRTWQSKCLFSGARGEVCAFEPLLQGNDINFLNRTVLVAMATLSKVIVISVRPKLKVHFNQQLPRISTSLPLLSWQMVAIGRTFQPVLAWGRGNQLNYTRVSFGGHRNSNRIRLQPLRSIQLNYSLIALHWMGSRHLATVDEAENLRLIEVRSQKDIELLELTDVGLVYNSAHFKALAVGGGVSEAFALAGQQACYNSLSSQRGGEILLILGTRAVHIVKLRTWPERLTYLSEQGKWAEALNLVINYCQSSNNNNQGQGGYNIDIPNRERFVVGLLNKYLDQYSVGGSDGASASFMDRDGLNAAINCCVQFRKIDILCNDLFEIVSLDPMRQLWYFTAIADHICNGTLTTLLPSTSQSLVSYLESRNQLDILEQVLLNLQITCLDLHQVLSVCKKCNLYTAWIHITTTAMGDYTSPLTEFLLDLTPDNHKLGNTMLVYVSSCLAGLGYPRGTIAEADVAKVKHDVLRCLETVHSVKNNENKYPYLRALLKYNMRDCLNVIELSFTEVEFSGELGYLQRQRLVQILMQIVQVPDFTTSQVINLACFISRLVVSGKLEISQAMLEQVIASLIGSNRINQEENTCSMSTSNLRDHNDREQAWLDLLNFNKLNHLSTKSLLDMALLSKCYRVAEHLYELQKNYDKILACYLNDPQRKEDVFHYILNYINKDNDKRCIKQQFQDHFKQLLSLDVKKTCQILLEYFPVESIQQFIDQMEGMVDLQYDFLTEIFFNSAGDVKLPISTDTTMFYLEQLCQRNNSNLLTFLQLHCHRIKEEALKITEKYNCHLATAFLLEKDGEWMAALELLIKHQFIEEAVALNIRATEHLDTLNAQKMWLQLLHHNNNKQDNDKNNYSVRKLLHAAAPYVRPMELMDLVSNAYFGDVKVLFQDILNDCIHNFNVLTSTEKLLNRDLHSGLVRSLNSHGRAISVSTLYCGLCQKPLCIHFSNNNILDSSSDMKIIGVWGCGHCFHFNCLKTAEVADSCPVCHKRCGFNVLSKHIPKTLKSPINSSNLHRYSDRSDVSNKSKRPDLEGDF